MRGQMKKLSLILIGLGFASASVANVTPPSEVTSRALQQARRVASMENGHDLPSRAVWLGQRVAKNDERLEVASAKKPARKTGKKTKTSVQN